MTVNSLRAFLVAALSTAFGRLSWAEDKAAFGAEIAIDLFCWPSQQVGLWIEPAYA